MMTQKKSVTSQSSGRGNCKDEAVGNHLLQMQGCGRHHGSQFSHTPQGFCQRVHPEKNEKIPMNDANLCLDGFCLGGRGIEGRGDTLR